MDVEPRAKNGDDSTLLYKNNYNTAVKETALQSQLPGADLRRAGLRVGIAWRNYETATLAYSRLFVFQADLQLTDGFIHRPESLLAVSLKIVSRFGDMLAGPLQGCDGVANFRMRSEEH